MYNHREAETKCHGRFRPILTSFAALCSLLPEMPILAIFAGFARYRNLFFFASFG
jgi:hypothetical protein